ncbi:hypothetical protein TL16_g06017 [Triparma laevis f. inornata]|uniref:RRM domain-containing protein n=2 Tax=Triparma laevis TaxID=1534972 RepID=A0A9W7F6G1_9STRA|nr:hypothetical protein TL16_g06017 [Triparma laevis f. inornata]GMI04226.1 hypothetical protein TrLO_g7253 [Triparma laevis f. longispina]
MSNKKSLYIGGLAESATPDLIKAAFIPFGDIRDVDVPMDFKTGTNKGFCFLTYLSPGDAAEALYNMDGSELLNRTLNVKYSSENKDYNPNSEAVWKGEKWIKEHASNEDDDEERKVKALQAQNGAMVG